MLAVVYTEIKRVYRIEDRQIQVRFATFARRYTSHHFRSIFNCLFAMEASLLSRESLADDARLCGQDQILAGRIVCAVEPHSARKAI